MTMTVAGAPVSFGVFEMTPEGAPTLSPDEILEILALAGYQGIDLGPVGFLGRGARLRRRLADHELELAGGWVELPFSDDEAFVSSLKDLDAALDVFREAAEAGPLRLPKPTLADEGSPARRQAPGRGTEVDRLSAAAAERLAANVGIAAGRVRAAGFEPTFHHHAGTFVESPDEIDWFLDRVDIGLTFDTGHLLIGGGDPLEALARWGSRVNHLHLKDVAVTELERVLRAGGGMADVWGSDAFVPFGRGDVALGAVMDAVAALDYDGWVVVEQDVLNPPDVALGDFRAARATAQISNREWLRPWC